MFSPTAKWGDLANGATPCCCSAIEMIWSNFISRRGGQPSYRKLFMRVFSSICINIELNSKCRSIISISSPSTVNLHYVYIYIYIYIYSAVYPHLYCGAMTSRHMGVR